MGGVNITTKYAIGDLVYPVWIRTYPVNTPCDECDGTGRAFLVRGGYVSCPTCMGRGKVTDESRTQWEVQPPSRVGLVEARVVSPEYKHQDSRISYMLWSTGIGASGTNWVEDVLCASEDEARAECDRRNTALLDGARGTGAGVAG